MNIMLMERPSPMPTPNARIWRHAPDDLIERYIELGLKGCIAHYRAHRETVRRWLEETGRRDELRELRIARVKTNYRQYLARQATMRTRTDRTRAEARRRAVCAAEPMPDADTIRAAAHFLRSPAAGRNMVCPSGHGDWFVGSVRVTPQDLVRRAVARGFPVSNIASEKE